MTDAAVREQLDRLLAARDPPKTFCPSEVARATGAAGWRELMPQVRTLLWERRAAGEVEILQRGAPIPADAGVDDVSGPIRARRTE